MKQSRIQEPRASLYPVWPVTGMAQVTPGPSSNQCTAIASFAVSAKSFDGRPTRPWRALYRSVSVQNPLRDLSSILQLLCIAAYCVKYPWDSFSKLLLYFNWLKHFVLDCRTFLVYPRPKFLHPALCESLCRLPFK